jgi:hypothetical protein
VGLDFDIGRSEAPSRGARSGDVMSPLSQPLGNNTLAVASMLPSSNNSIGDSILDMVIH